MCIMLHIVTITTYTSKQLTLTHWTIHLNRSIDNRTISSLLTTIIKILAMNILFYKALNKCINLHRTLSWKNCLNKEATITIFSIQ